MGETALMPTPRRACEWRGIHPVCCVRNRGWGSQHALHRHTNKEGECMAKALACLSLLVMMPVTAAASDRLGYTYVEGGYDRIEPRELYISEAKSSGAYVRGSFALTESVFVFGGYAERDGTVHRTFSLSDGVPFRTHTKMDQRATEAGLGFRAPVGKRLDFIGELSYFNIDRDMTFTVDGGEVAYLSWRDLDGTSATVGLRGGSEHIEGWIKVGYRDSNDFRENFVGTLGAQYRFTDTWGVVAEWEDSDEMRRYRVGLRASF
jgi:hypothetical protein